jgi:CheY-like chemotaxis protein
MINVLVADDELPAIEELAFLLGKDERIGTIHRASSGNEALRALETEAVDAVFLDIHMPAVSGLDIARVISRSSRPPAVVFVTADEDCALEAFELAAVDYLLKPVRAERLARSVGRISELSANRMAIYAAYMLMLLGTVYMGGVAYGGLGRLVGYVGYACFLIFFFLFPDGHFVPGWTRWVATLGIFRLMVALAFPGTPLDFGGDSLLLYVVEVASWLGLGVAAQVYRYRRHATPAQRQQAKWVVGGCSVGLTVQTTTIFLFDILFPGLAPAGAPLDLATRVIGIGSLVFLPLTLTIAILRLRLWDIDRLINRALVYGALTGTLAIVYAGSVAALQAVAQALTGQTQPSQLAVVASTLLIAALFQPLRHRLQGAIDRRFYRRKYDAAQTLAAFGARLRDETDLERLSAHVVATVEETAHWFSWGF